MKTKVKVFRELDPYDLADVVNAFISNGDTYNRDILSLTFSESRGGDMDWRAVLVYSE